MIGGSSCSSTSKIGGIRCQNIIHYFVVCRPAREVAVLFIAHCTVCIVVGFSVPVLLVRSAEVWREVTPALKVLALVLKAQTHAQRAG